MTFCTLAILFFPTVLTILGMAGWAYGRFLEQGEINGVRRNVLERPFGRGETGSDKQVR